MTLKVLNNSGSEFLTDESILTSHNGFTGEAFVTKIQLTNKDEDKWYSGIVVKVDMGNELPENSLFSTSGWSVKFLVQDSEPTELEWSRAALNTEATVQNFGSSAQADISTIKTVWIRVFCPGNTEPQVKENISIIVDYTENTVNAQ